jgi:hypothetical protein
MHSKQYVVVVSSRDFQKFLVEACCESEAEDKALDLFSDGIAGTPVYSYDADTAVIEVLEAPSGSD